MNFDEVCADKIWENEAIYIVAMQIRLHKRVYFNMHHSADMDRYICVVVPVQCNKDRENTGIMKLYITRVNH